MNISTTVPISKRAEEKYKDDHKLSYISNKVTLTLRTNPGESFCRCYKLRSSIHPYSPPSFVTTYRHYKLTRSISTCSRRYHYKLSQRVIKNRAMSLSKRARKGK